MHDKIPKYQLKYLIKMRLVKRSKEPQILLNC